RDPSGAAPPAARWSSSLWAYFVLTFALTWTCWALVATRVPLRSAGGQALLDLGVFAPAIVSLALTLAGRGGVGVRMLLSRVLPVPVAGRWVAFAMGYTLSIKLAAALLLRLTTGTWPRLGSAPLALIPFAIALSTPVQAGEE